MKMTLPDARGWIGIGVFFLTTTVIAMTAFIPDLREDEFFKNIAILIVGAFIKDVVSWAYNSTKNGGELAASNAVIVAAAARPSLPNPDAPIGTYEDPVHVIPDDARP